jgi:hypothetical protein
MMIDVVLRGLQGERPEWEVTLDGMRGSMHPNINWSELQNRLMMAEVMNAAKLALVSMTQTQAVARTATVPTSHLEARVTELEALVRNMTKRVTPTGNGSNFNRNETRTCNKCGVVDIFLGIVLKFRLGKVLFAPLWPQCAHHGCLILDAVMTCILGVMMLE